MARTLTLVKHARPEKLEGVDSHEWPLSAQGKADTAKLASLLQSRTYAAVITSSEPKAAETGDLLAAALSLTATRNPGLNEHDRSNVPLMKTPEFVSAIANFFRRPTQLVLGNETARQALKRFELAMDDVLAKHPTGDLLIVSHGTVLALWIAQYAQTDPYETWRKMGLPSYVHLDWPSCEILDRKDQI
jgi:broad specificity phosphatase PhoE